MKNFIKLVWAELLSDIGNIAYWALFILVTAILEKIGYWHTSPGMAPLIAATMSESLSINKPNLAYYVNSPISKRAILFIRPMKLVLQSIILIAFECGIYRFLAPAQFEKYIKDMPIHLGIIALFVMIILLYREVNIFLKIENKALRAFTAGSIIGSPIIACQVLSEFDLLNKSVGIGLLAIYTLVCAVKIYTLFNKRKEYLYFSGKPIKQPNLQLNMFKGR